MIKTSLVDVYEEIMWLANRPNTSPSAARAWYTHVVSNRLRKNIRRFTGMVSQNALEEGAVLRLEHFKRIQTTLTKLIDSHIRNGIHDAEEFVRVVLDCEQVHIVTAKENYEAMKAKGDYDLANIALIEWSNIPVEKQHFLWGKMLRGKVSNAGEFSPNVNNRGQRT